MITLSGTNPILSKHSNVDETFVSDLSDNLSFFHTKLPQWKFWRWASPVALVGRKVSEFFSEKNYPCRCFGAGQHQWHWLEGNFLNYFLQKTIFEEVLALGGTNGTGWKESF